MQVFVGLHQYYVNLLFLLALSLHACYRLIACGIDTIVEVLVNLGCHP